MFENDDEMGISKSERDEILRKAVGESLDEWNKAFSDQFGDLIVRTPEEAEAYEKEYEKTYEAQRQDKSFRRNLRELEPLDLWVNEYFEAKISECESQIAENEKEIKQQAERARRWKEEFEKEPPSYLEYDLSEYTLRYRNEKVQYQSRLDSWKQTHKMSWRNLVGGEDLDVAIVVWSPPEVVEWLLEEQYSTPLAWSTDLVEALSYTRWMCEEYDINVNYEIKGWGEETFKIKRRKLFSWNNSLLLQGRQQSDHDISAFKIMRSWLMYWYLQSQKARRKRKS